MQQGQLVKQDQREALAAQVKKVQLGLLARQEPRAQQELMDQLDQLDQQAQREELVKQDQLVLQE